MESIIPIEMWRYIFGFLNKLDLLNVRFVCRNWNELSITEPRWLDFKIILQDNQKIEKFLELMRNRFNNDLKFHTFNLNIFYISVENLQILIQDFGTDFVELNFFDPNWRPKPHTLLQELRENVNIILNGTPNLQCLRVPLKVLKPELDFPPLMKLHTLSHIVLPHCNDFLDSYANGFINQTKIHLMNNLISKAPNLKKFAAGRLTEYTNTNSMDLVQTLQLVPQLSCQFNVNFGCPNYGSLIKSLQFTTKFQSIYFFLDNAIFQENRLERIKSFHLFLSRQADSLKSLLMDIKLCGDIEIPPLKKLENLSYYLTGPADATTETIILPLDPINFPSLKRIFLNTHEHEYFNIFDKQYPTVRDVRVKRGPYKEWQKVFPNLIKYQFSCFVVKILRLLLNELQTVQNLSINLTRYWTCKNYSEDMLKFLINNPPPPVIKKLRLRVKFGTPMGLGYTNADCVEPGVLWNILTGNAVVESSSLFSIKGVNDVPSETKLPNQNSLNNLTSLKYLEIHDYNCKKESIMALAYLSQQDSFPRLNKLQLNFYGTKDIEGNIETILDQIPEEIFNILKEKFSYRIQIIKHVIYPLLFIRRPANGFIKSSKYSKF